MGTTLQLLLAGAVVLLFGWQMKRGRSRQRVAYLADYDFARLLDRRLALRRPQLDAAQRRLVFDGLRQWFALCQHKDGRRLSMPSQAVDDAWHEFILFTRNYAQFCQRALGRFLHHVPAEAMSSPTQAQRGIRATWQLACRAEGIAPDRPSHLPLLFALDAQLGLADGFHYSLDCRDTRAAGGAPYCASHIGCGSGCSSDSGGDGGGSSCGGGCGGD